MKRNWWNIWEKYNQRECNNNTKTTLIEKRAGMRGKRWKKIICVIVAAWILFLNFTYVQARGDEAAEENLFNDFQEMDYYMFLETDVGYGVSGDYCRYGIYGNITLTPQAGEELYFMLNEKVLGEKLALYTHEEWHDHTEEFIRNISPDLNWIISRQYAERLGKYTDTLYYKNQKLGQRKGHDKDEITVWEWNKEKDKQSFELMKEEKISECEKLITDLWGWGYCITGFAWEVSCMDKYGELLAVSDPDNQSIRIYDTEGWALLHHITMEELKEDFPIEISQIEGNRESGWLLFSDGDNAYRMEYPDGKPEKTGEFMYAATISPDGKYRAYCTANWVLEDAWLTMPYEKRASCENEFYRRWDRVPSGWYVEELETGNKTYIPVETWKQDGRRLNGGRCVWIQKDKLQQTLMDRDEFQ